MGAGGCLDALWWANASTRDDASEPLNLKCFAVDKKPQQTDFDLPDNLVYVQRDFEKAHEETGISIEEWYKSQPDRNKAIYGLESYYRRPITDNLWDRVMIAIDSMFPNSIAIDSDGNEYNRNTGERIEKPTGLDSNTASIIRSVIQSLSI